MILATGSVKPRPPGFTLIELILVMSLLVIVTSIAVPAMARFVRGRALDSETRRVLAVLHLAQSRAVSEGSPVYFWLDEKSRAYGVTAETRGQSGDPRAETLTVDATLGLTGTQTGVSSPVQFNNLPAVKFLPDGTIDEGSLAAVILADTDGFQRQLVENKTRNGYEVGGNSK